MVESPIDNIPLFVMAGSIIPVLDPRVLTLNNATNYSVTTWWSLRVTICTTWWSLRVTICTTFGTAAPHYFQ